MKFTLLKLCAGVNKVLIEPAAAFPLSLEDFKDSFSCNNKKNNFFIFEF